MKAIVLCLLALLVPCSGIGGDARTPSRDGVVALAEFFEEERLYLAASADLVQENLLRSEYASSSCDGTSSDERHASDLLWHSTFFAIDEADWGTVDWEELVGKSVRGWPYSYGAGFSDPESGPDVYGIQARLDSGEGFGNHWCHYAGNGCGYPGCTWSVGIDCSGLASVAGGIAYIGTYDLQTGSSTVTIDFADVDVGTLFVKASNHVAIVRSRTGPSADIIEATGEWPVVRSVLGADIAARYQSQNYTAVDFSWIGDVQGSDGFLTAIPWDDGSVELCWTVESSRDVRFCEFEYQDPAGSWVPFTTRDFRPEERRYRALYSPTLAGAGAGLLFQVRVHDWDGTSRPTGRTRPFRPRNLSQEGVRR